VWIGELDATAYEVRYQVAGGRQQRGADVLGWEAALQTFRPLLSYEELGQILTTKPSALHDAIASVLGLGDLEAAIARVAARVKPLAAPHRRSNDERKVLRGSLSKIAVLSSQNAFARIASVRLPGRNEVIAAAAAVQEAADRLAAVGDERSRLEQLRDTLLAEALRYQAEAGSEIDCPVCDSGRLDDDWRARTEAAIHEVDLLTLARRDAENSFSEARAAAERLLTGPPPVIGQTDVPLASPDAVRRHWQAWQCVPSGGSLADHIRARFDTSRTRSRRGSGRRWRGPTTSPVDGSRWPSRSARGLRRTRRPSNRSTPQIA
jgi:hypothetical protein